MSAIINLRGCRAVSLNALKLGDVKRLITSFRLLNPEMQAQMMDVLIEVAMAHPDPLSMIELTHKTMLAQSSVSRNVAALGKYDRKGAPGMGMVRAFENPEDRRYKLVSLTNRGERFISMLLEGQRSVQDKTSVMLSMSSWEELKDRNELLPYFRSEVQKKLLN